MPYFLPFGVELSPWGHHFCLKHPGILNVSQPQPSRRRPYLTRPKTDGGEEIDDLERVLSRKKANYAGAGDSISLRWEKGVFVAQLTTLREKLIKIGAKVVRHGRYITFQLAEVAVPKELFRKILSLIDDLRRRSVPA